MWDFLVKLVWLPFEIMQRISNRIFLVGRSIYGSLTGSGKKPLEPPPPPSPKESSPLLPSSSPTPGLTTSQLSSSSSSPSQLKLKPNQQSSSSSSSTITIPPKTFCIVDMEQDHLRGYPDMQMDLPEVSIADHFPIEGEGRELETAASGEEFVKGLMEIKERTRERLRHHDRGDEPDDLEFSIICAPETDEDFLFSFARNSAEPACPISPIAPAAVTVSNVVTATATTTVAASPAAASVSEESAEVQVELEQAQAHTSASVSSSSTSVTTSRANTAINTKRYRDKEKRKVTRDKNKQMKAAAAAADDDGILTEEGSASASSVQAQSQSEEQFLTKLPKTPSNKKLKLSEEETSTYATCKEEASTTGAEDETDKPKRKKKRPKKKNKQQEQNSEVVSAGATGAGGSGMAQCKPNFFIAVQITCKKIISRVAQLQKSLSEKQLAQPWHGLSTAEIFKDAMVPVAKLHFTLHVMNLEGDEDVERAKVALVECCSEVQKEFAENPLDLNIEGLGHFKNSVLFAQVKDENGSLDRLTKLANLFRKKFDELNIQGDPRQFKAHMTIAKVSRSNKLYKKKIRSFPPDIMSGLEEMNFGIQRVNGVQLLCMAGEDKATGYYRCFGQHYFIDPLESPENKDSSAESMAE